MNLWSDGYQYGRREVLEALERCELPGPIARALMHTPAELGAALRDWAGAHRGRNTRNDLDQLAAGLRALLEVIEE